MQKHSIARAVSGARWNPRDGLIGSDQGLWLDPSDLTTLFQDAAGTTPVTAVEQPVGLLLDKSKGLVLGPELVTNGALTSGTGWTDTGVATITYSGAGARIVSPANGAGLLSQNYAGVVNKTYVVDAEVVMHATPLAPASVAVNIGGSGENLFVSTRAGLIAGNTYRLHGKVRLTSATSFLLRIGSGEGQNYALDFTIRNLSIRELPGNHAKQATATARPVLSARVNMLGWTGGAAGWFGVPGANEAIPESASAIRLTTFAENTTQHFSNSVGFGSGDFCFSMSAKANGFRRVGMRVYDGSAYRISAVFDLVSGTIISNTAGAATISPLPLGGYRISCAGNSPSGNMGSTSGWDIDILNDSATAPQQNCLGDGVGGIYVWDPQIARGLDIKPYQRVNTATDYDSDPTKFPRQIKYSSGQSLTVNFPSSLGSDCVIARADPGVSAVIAENQTFNTPLTLNTSHSGLVITSRDISVDEKARLDEYLDKKSIAK